ncbi:hypothetical protein A28LD_1384 [Idiomarina sp. A28L]|nr:hypothetical protein A28LD_1384 [Idiomarina sp. A28L]
MLIQRGFNQKMVPTVLGCLSSLISEVISRNARSFRVSRAIACALELELYDVFPELRDVRENSGVTYSERFNRLRMLIG